MKLDPLLICYGALIAIAAFVMGFCVARAWG